MKQSHELFGSTIACECGKTHVIEPREIVFADDAIAQLPAACDRHAPGQRVAVIADSRTWVVAGGAVAEALAQAGRHVHRLIVEDPREGASPVCDDVTKDILANRLEAVDVIVPVGAGVVNDLGKWLAADRGLPFITFATAASMNGYTSANIAPTVNGLKTLLRGYAAKAVLSSPAVLRDAPYKMTASGLGDVVAKSVSSADWFMNHSLFGDYYCARSVGLIARIEPLYLQHPADVRQRKPAAIAALYEALLLTGAAMTMAETSAPSSGGEHMISHCMDMMSTVDGRGHDLHGRQVGVGTVLAAELYQRVLAVESPEFSAPPAGVDERFWGPLAGVMVKEYAAKQPRYAAAREALSQGGRWDRLRQQLSAMLRPPAVIAAVLGGAGAACRAADIGCDRPRLLAAFLHAHEIRSRFTVLDLAYLLGLLPGDLVEIVDQWG